MLYSFLETYFTYINRILHTFVTSASTLGTTAQISHESARTTLKNVLRDVIIAGPREATSVVRADHVEW